VPGTENFGVFRFKASLVVFISYVGYYDHIPLKRIIFYLSNKVFPTIINKSKPRWPRSLLNVFYGYFEYYPNQNKFDLEVYTV